MENKNGRGIFLGVVSVATLIVAIIGATFAYFSASSGTTNDVINGATLDIGAGSLSISVTPVDFEQTAANGRNLVPANITVSTNGVQGALNENCIDGNYTGCHVYDIHATSAAALTDATLTLTMNTSATVKTDWKYIIYTDTSTNNGKTASDLPTGLNGSFAATNPTTVNIIDNGALSSGDSHWYLMIYLADDSAVQNAADDNNAEGSYYGNVQLAAGAGTVQATFTAA